MKAKNRLFAILLALTMVITYTPGLAYALEGQPAASPASGETHQDSGQAAPTEDQAGGKEDPAGEAVDAGNDDTAAPEATQKKSSEPAAEQDESADPEDLNKVNGAEVEEEGLITVPKAKLASGDELLMNFLEDTAKGDPDGDSGNKPDEAESPEDMIYYELLCLIESIATGEEYIPKLVIDPSELTGSSFEYTAEELGLDSIFEGGQYKR